ncbi:PAS domain S-box-containing protein [Lachnospiraceae bacterium XBB1006]|nr:PAS domain S-box-containing protein [Lachnospiraceae bacterium XBB1006]
MNEGLIRLEDFCNMEKLADILRKWTKATHTAIALVNREKTEVLLEFGMGTCCGCIREKEEGKKICKTEWEHSEPGIYLCPVGMHGFVLPIELQNQQRLAYLYAGGVYIEEEAALGRERSRQVMQQLGISEEAIERIVASVTIKSQSELEGAFELLKEIIGDFVEKSYTVWQKNEDIRKKDAWHEEIIKSLDDIGIGSWIMERDADEVWMMHGDRCMNELLGTPEDMDPKERYTFWINRVEETSREIVMDFYRTLLEEGHAECAYTWNHPKNGVVYVRCGASMDKDKPWGTFFRGYHQDVTEKVMNEQVAEDAYQAVRAFSSLYSGTWTVDVLNDELTVLKPHFFKQDYIRRHGNSALVATKALVQEFVAEQSGEQFTELENYEQTAKKLRRRRSINWEFLGIDAKWYRITAVPLKKGAGGVVEQILYGVQEITEEKNRELEARRYLEEANRRATMQLDTISRAMPGGFKISRNDPMYTFRYVSTQFAALLGYTVEELYEVSGGTMATIVHKGDIARELPKALEMYTVGDTYVMKYRLRCKDGSWKYVMDRGRKVYLEDGTFENWCLILDIDEQERLNRQLQEERKQYREALIQDSVYFYTIDLTDGYLRKPFLLNTGEDALEVMGLTVPVQFDELLDSFQTVTNSIPMNIDPQKTFPTLQGLLAAYRDGRKRCEFEYFDPRLKQYHRMVVLMSESQENEHIIACVIGQDITEQKTKMERAFGEVKRANKAKTEFLSRMSHDIRTPMNGIIGMAKIARANMDEPERLMDALDKIEMAGKQLEMLINDVLDMSRLESGKTELTREAFSLRDVLENAMNAISTMAAEREVHVYPLECEGEHCRVLGSPLHTQRILLNILSNSIKYNKQGGSLRVAGKEEIIDENHSMFHFVIADTGIGMSPEFLERIFEPFSREHTDAGTKYQGTGLGMAIMKELVDLMNGTIRIESEVDRGSTFYLDLPFELAEEEIEIEKEEEEDTGDLEGMNVMLVEDNQINMEIAKFILESVGVNIIPMVNGKKAVDYFVRTAHGDIDVILMDVMMPVMDGIRATRLIRQSAHEDAKTIPIIAMTANAFVEDMKKTKEAGMNEHLSKPLDPQKVIQALKTYKKRGENNEEG